jgi:hypothetical protein
MLIEHELGTLIRRMNPYTNGTRGTMLFGSVGLPPVVAPAAAAAAAQAAGTAAQAAHVAAAAAAQAARDAAAAAAQAAATAARAEDAPNAAAATFTELARARMAADIAIAAAERAADAADPNIDLTHIDLVVDDFIANYSSADWVFRGRPQTVKRALRITYRYPYVDGQKNLTGLYATEHILVGYAGGNGSG